MGSETVYEKFYVVLNDVKDLPPLGKDITQRRVYVKFSWNTDDYQTSEVKTTSSTANWSEEFELDRIYGGKEILRAVVMDASYKPHMPLGKVAIDLKMISAQVSDGYYRTSASAGQPQDIKQCSVRIHVSNVSADDIYNVVEEKKKKAAEVLPEVEEDSSEDEEEESTQEGGETKRLGSNKGLDEGAKRKAKKLTDVRGELKKAYSYKGNDDTSDEQSDYKPRPSNLAKFWELRPQFISISDYKIHRAIEKADGDVIAAAELLTAKMRKQAREVGEHLRIEMNEEIVRDEKHLAEQRRQKRVIEKMNQMAQKAAAAANNADGLIDADVFFDDKKDTKSSKKKELGIKKAATARRKALLIGVDYTDNATLSLSGVPLKDLIHVREYLSSIWDFAFDVDACVTLADDHPDKKCKPTKANIMNGIEWLASHAESGDSLFLYFIGRGGMLDQSPVENSQFKHELPYL